MTRTDKILIDKRTERKLGSEKKFDVSVDQIQNKRVDLRCKLHGLLDRKQVVAKGSFWGTMVRKDLHIRQETRLALTT